MATTFYYHHRYGKHVLERLDYRITLIAHVKIKPPCQTPVHRARFLGFTKDAEQKKSMHFWQEHQKRRRRGG